MMSIDTVSKGSEMSRELKQKIDTQNTEMFKQVEKIISNNFIFIKHAEIMRRGLNITFSQNLESYYAVSNYDQYRSSSALEEGALHTHAANSTLTNIVQRVNTAISLQAARPDRFDL